MCYSGMKYLSKRQTLGKAKTDTTLTLFKRTIFKNADREIPRENYYGEEFNIFADFTISFPITGNRRKQKNLLPLDNSHQDLSKSQKAKILLQYV